MPVLSEISKTSIALVKEVSLKLYRKYSKSIKGRALQKY
jgi:hypothetical protein